MKTLTVDSFMGKFSKFVDMRDKLFELGIRCSYYAPNRNADPKYIVLSTVNKRFEQHNDKEYSSIIHECAGMIYDWENKRVIAAPLSYLMPCQTIPKNMDFSNVTIREIYDGTVLNLYYDCEKWNFGSTNGIDVADRIWEKKTFRDSFKETMLTYNIKFDDFKKDLNPKRTYSFGFKHHDIHPFNSKYQHNLWFVKSSELKYYGKTGKVKYYDEFDPETKELLTKYNIQSQPIVPSKQTADISTQIKN